MQVPCSEQWELGPPAGGKKYPSKDSGVEAIPSTLPSLEAVLICFSLQQSGQTRVQGNQLSVVCPGFTPPRTARPHVQF